MRPDRRLLLLAALLAVVFMPVPAAPTSAAGSEPSGPDEVPCWERERPCAGSLDVATETVGPAGEDADPGPEPIVISRASGRSGPDRAEMAAWHRRYLLELAPVKGALARVLAAAPTARPPALVPHCRRLADALAGIDRRVLLPAPDLATDLYLKRVLARLGDAAAACTERSFARTDLHLLEASHAIGQLDLALRHYGLGW